MSAGTFCNRGHSGGPSPNEHGVHEVCCSTEAWVAAAAQPKHCVGLLPQVALVILSFSKQPTQEAAAQTHRLFHLHSGPLSKQPAG